MVIRKFTVFLLMVIMASCGENSKRKSMSGKYTYTVIKEANTKVPENYQYIIANVKAVDNRDSVWLDKTDLFNNMAIQKRIQSAQEGDSSINEIFYDLSQGDSVTFQISIKDFFKSTVKSLPPPTVDMTGSLTFYAGVDTIIAADAYAEYGRFKYEMARERNERILKKSALEDSKEIAKFLSERGVETVVSPYGVHVHIIREGTGPKIKPFDKVLVNYSGFLLSDSTYFDTNIQEVARDKGLYHARKSYKPYDIIIDKSKVIQGWHEGFKMLKKGTKAILIIPSPLGYGSRWARNGKIPPDSELVFEVEVIDILRNEGE